ncbi:isocitrate lyase/PEP mutase family protein [Aureivirga marina]|uniref:isocitrate lyase/PEP mutase family protein n=1 Tax=Aureivirga marina TaxID=1182451 RepID=UPI0018CB9E93|nr:isocitrate lyase/phosphoenolpyruvate mutase family protein [Aureivirga marina]
MNFKDLHYQNKPLIIGNVWDVPSVKVAERLNFQAIGTSSSAIASLLGYKDGENMSFSELEYFVERIISSTNLPLTVDLEAGFSRKPKEIITNIRKLYELGVVGINIEDSLVTTDRKLVDKDVFAVILKEIKKGLQEENMKIFLNVRIDTFMLLKEDIIQETKERIELYQNVGADGIFIPCLEKEEDIKEIVDFTELPINVMCMPSLPDFEILKELGVKRISMGNFIFDKMYHHFFKTSKEIINQKSFKSIF